MQALTYRQIPGPARRRNGAHLRGGLAPERGATLGAIAVAAIGVVLCAAVLQIGRAPTGAGAGPGGATSAPPPTAGAVTTAGAADPIDTLTTPGAVARAVPGVSAPPPSATAPADSLGDGWVVVLAQVDIDRGRDALETALAPMRGAVPSAWILESDFHPSLAPGDWVVVDGPFSSGTDAAAHCRALGPIVGGDCVARVLSDSTTDRVRWCAERDDRFVGTCD